MKKEISLKFFVTLLGLLNSFASLIAQTPYTLYVSKQTNEKTEFTGNYNKSTDKYEHGTVNLSTVGPITHSINPNSLSIGINETKAWNGNISPDLTQIPAPGTATNATLTADYNLYYSRPYGTGTNGTVQSTYNCASSGSSHDGCDYHAGNPGMHELVNDAGSVILPFLVISVVVDLPDTICLGKTGQGNVTPISFPVNGANFLWTSGNPAVQITNGNQKTALITLLDTNIKNAVVKVRFEINGVTYTDQGVLSTCECNCTPITRGITAGPVTLSFNINPDNASPDGQGICRYTANDAAFNMNMLGIINRTADVPKQAKVKFGKDCKTGTLTDVSVDWTGDISIPAITFSAINLVQVTTFDLNVKEIHLMMATNGNLSGTVKVLVTNPVDRDLSGNTGFVMLRKGTNSTVTFTFNNTAGFNGTWDWRGLQGINIDLVKKNNGADVIIANFTGNYAANGILSGDLKVVAEASYKTNLFTVTMKQLTLGLEMDIGNATMKLTSGSGKVQISQMAAVNGTIDLGLIFPAGGGCQGTVGVSNMTAFSMTLDQLNLQVDFNKNFDMTKVQGNLKAKHNQFDAKIDVSQFEVVDGALTKFSASGDVKYQAFKFTLMNSTYVNNPTSLVISAKVEMDAAGASAMITVTGFKIDGNGTITVGSISGNLNRPPATFAFSATFGNSRFTGTFNGKFASIGLDGAIDVGSMENPDYNFAYLAITVKADVPLGQSGLKLTQVGGQCGFNYKLDFPNNGTGNPQQNNYVVGLKLGVADVADMCEVTGNAIIQFNTFGGNVIITLNGTIAVLKNNTFFDGNVNVNYRIPQMSIDGSIGAVVKIPASGFIVTTNNCNVAFNIGNNKWSANGNNMGGSMFNGIIQLSNGSINMGGSLSSPTDMSGTLGGKATGSFKYGLSVSAIGNTVSGDIALSLNSDINASIDQNGLSGTFGVHVTGDGTLTLTTWLLDQTFQGNADANGQVGYNGGTLSMWGNMTVTLPISIPFWGNQISTGFNISI